LTSVTITKFVSSRECLLHFSNADWSMYIAAMPLVH